MKDRDNFGLTLAINNWRSKSFTLDRTLTHSGDLGDIVAALPILRAMGGGKIILFDDRELPVGVGSREGLKGARYEAIRPLLAAQPYVTSVEWKDFTRMEMTGGIDKNPFRLFRGAPRENLIKRQARHAGLWPLDTSAWLTVPFSKHRRVIVARSVRHRNDFKFPWADIVKTYGKLILFVGLKEEHAALEAEVQQHVEHAVTKNLLEVASVMAGAPLIYANQSCPLWIAMGLGQRVIVEVATWAPNSEVHTHPKSFFAETAADMMVLRRSLQKLRK